MQEARHPRERFIRRPTVAGRRRCLRSQVHRGYAEPPCGSLGVLRAHQDRREVRRSSVDPRALLGARVDLASFAGKDASEFGKIRGAVDAEHLIGWLKLTRTPKENED